MFTNQKNSEHKFWLMTLIFSLLMFSGQLSEAYSGAGKCLAPQGADVSKCTKWEVCHAGGCSTYNPQKANSTAATTDCQTKCGGQCYSGARYPSNSQCVCGNNYCLADACKRKGWFPTGDSNPSNRCSQTDPKKAQAAQEDPSKGKCVGSNVVHHADHGGADGLGQCVCTVDGQKYDAANGGCKASSSDDKGDIQAACKAAGGTPQSDDSCICAGDVIYGRVAEGQDCSSGQSTSVAGYVASCKAAGGKLQGNECICDSNDQPASRVDEESGSWSWQCEAKVAALSEADRYNKIFQECGFNTAMENFKACEESKSEAVEKCEVQYFEDSKTNDELKGVLGVLSQIQQKKGAESADPDVCSKAAYGATAGYWALDAFKTDCTEKIKICKQACNPLAKGDTFKAMGARCEAMFNKEFANEYAQGTANSGRETPDQIFARRLAASKKSVGKSNGDITKGEALRGDIKDQVLALENEVKESLAKCETDAVKGEEQYAKYLADLLGASVSAAQCKNLAGSGGARCLAIQAQITPANCAANPAEPCCAPLLTGGLKCDGADAGHKNCVCVKTPDAAICKTLTGGGGSQVVGTPGGLNQVAAPGGIMSNSAYKPGSGLNGNALDLSGGDDPAAAAAAAKESGSSNPFGTASSSGGGGGGLGGGSGGGEAGAPGEGSGEPTPGVVGGAFNQLKTLADRIFGSGGSGNSGRTFGGGNNAKDPKKGAGANKPNLRGVATVNPKMIGPRNKDIWKIMNAQYGVQNHTFFSTVEGK